jgi:hypothetical protein
MVLKAKLKMPRSLALRTRTKWRKELVHEIVPKLCARCLFYERRRNDMTCRIALNRICPLSGCRQERGKKAMSVIVRRVKGGKG